MTIYSNFISNNYIYFGMIETRSITKMNKQKFVELISSTKFLLIVTLLLAAFTHLWNISQFPGIHIDEGHYIRRALHVLSGLGPQENTSNYDHPFMGQIVLAQLFG